MADLLIQAGADPKYLAVESEKNLYQKKYITKYLEPIKLSMPLLGYLYFRLDFLSEWLLTPIIRLVAEYADDLMELPQEDIIARASQVRTNSMVPLAKAVKDSSAQCVPAINTMIENLGKTQYFSPESVRDYFLYWLAAYAAQGGIIDDPGITQNLKKVIGDEKVLKQGLKTQADPYEEKNICLSSCRGKILDDKPIIPSSIKVPASSSGLSP